MNQLVTSEKTEGSLQAAWQTWKVKHENHIFLLLVATVIILLVVFKPEGVSSAVNASNLTDMTP